MGAKRLNVGCGKDIRAGWVNLDVTALPGVDVVHDIERLPLPFEDGEFDEIRCENVLEHVDYAPVLKELYRILRPAGLLKIRVPHFTSRNNWVDPTHRKSFSIETFDFFVKGSQAEKDKGYYFDFCFGKMLSRRIKFLKRGLFWGNRLVEPLVNCSPKVQWFYESSFLCRLFPANDVVIELVK